MVSSLISLLRIEIESFWVIWFEDSNWATIEPNCLILLLLKWFTFLSDLTSTAASQLLSETLHIVFLIIRVLKDLFSRQGNKSQRIPWFFFYNSSLLQSFLLSYYWCRQTEEWSAAIFSQYSNIETVWHFLTFLATQWEQVIVI